jgi:DNA-binding NarL/FixJ family response regulator
MPVRQGRVLIVDDEPVFRDVLRSLLVRGGVPNANIVEAAGVASALDVCARLQVAVVLADDHLCEPRDGLDLLARVGAQHPTTARGLVTSSPDPALAQAIGRHEVDAFLRKPLDGEAMLQAVRNLFTLHIERRARAGAATSY